MHFRSSLYKVDFSEDEKDLIWIEAHQVSGHFIIVKLTGNPDTIVRSEKAPFLPANALPVDIASDGVTALQSVFECEGDLAEFCCITDFGFRKLVIPHYIELIDVQLPLVLIPAYIMDTLAASFFPILKSLSKNGDVRDCERALEIMPLFESLRNKARLQNLTRNPLKASCALN